MYPDEHPRGSKEGTPCSPAEVDGRDADDAGPAATRDVCVAMPTATRLPGPDPDRPVGLLCPKGTSVLLLRDHLSEQRPD